MEYLGRAGRQALEHELRVRRLEARMRKVTSAAVIPRARLAIAAALGTAAACLALLLWLKGTGR